MEQVENSFQLTKIMIGIRLEKIISYIKFVSITGVMSVLSFLSLQLETMSALSFLIIGFCNWTCIL